MSSNGSDFNHDYHVSFSKDELAKGKVYYNYTMIDPGVDELSGMSVFYTGVPGCYPVDEKRAERERREHGGGGQPHAPAAPKVPVSSQQRRAGTDEDDADDQVGKHVAHVQNCR